ncbi:hypothetical protein L2E82_33085 [Cichorium intybus]|uniref:Uncharacterized protein n=1 Tax=Cichorium intybus TaxID=13427 RepID=A0ACB9BJ82_CICIN|nr:hypothetical protein L2E82_33085 [Cichorium intybus]
MMDKKTNNIPIHLSATFTTVSRRAFHRSERVLSNSKEFHSTTMITEKKTNLVLAINKYYKLVKKKRKKKRLVSHEYIVHAFFP